MSIKLNYCFLPKHFSIRFETSRPRNFVLSDKVSNEIRTQLLKHDGP